MARYIDIDNLYKKLADKYPLGYNNDDLAEELQNQPTADVKEVMRGE